MPIPDGRSKYKRTNLFLLRVWCDDLDQNENRNGDEGETSGLVWHGRVQQTVSGEAHSFNGKQGLFEVLEAMLYKDRKDTPEHTKTGSREKISSDIGPSVSGNSQNQTEANEGSEYSEGTQGTR